MDLWRPYLKESAHCERECKPRESASAGICSARSVALVGMCDKASRYVRWIPFMAWRPYLNESANCERECKTFTCVFCFCACKSAQSIHSQRAQQQQQQCERSGCCCCCCICIKQQQQWLKAKGEGEQQISNWPRLTRQKGEREGRSSTWKVKFEWENISLPYSLPCCTCIRHRVVSVSVCLCLYLFWGA